MQEEQLKPRRTPGAGQTSGDAILEPLRNPTLTVQMRSSSTTAPVANRVQGFAESRRGRDGSRTRSTPDFQFPRRSVDLRKPSCSHCVCIPHSRPLNPSSPTAHSWTPVWRCVDCPSNGVFFRQVRSVSRFALNFGLQSSALISYVELDNSDQVSTAVCSLEPRARGFR